MYASLARPFAATLVLLLAACGDDGEGALGADPEPEFGCSLDNSMVCVEYVGADVVDALCGQQGTSEEACTEEGLVGVCVSQAGTGSETVSYFYDSFYDEDSAAEFCADMGGDFSPA